MKKIPTVFERDWNGDRSRVLNKVHPGCEYQHCAKKHMHRYLAEFDFRYSNRIAKGVDDSARADRLLKGVVGKRLTYETTHTRECSE